MRKLTMSLVTAGLLIVVAITSSTSMAQRPKGKQAVERTIIGYISDASCGLKHMEGMNEKDCTLMCARNGKFVLADRDKKVVYQLDEAGQKKAPEFAGQKVKVTGRLTGKRIRVISIEAAS
jgi:hypothetical protein